MASIAWEVKQWVGVSQIDFKLIFLGITLLETPKIGEPIKIGGVASVIKAPSAEAALEEVKLDPYYINGIWDPSTVSYHLAILKPLKSKLIII
jgi:hypothetical protein